MRCVILQPSYIPWRGYFHQIQKADTFVFYDDVQYDRRGWRARNRIKGANGAFWLTVPVKSQGIRRDARPIADVRIDWDQAWSERHRASIRNTYARAPFLAHYSDLLDEIYARRDERIADFTIESTKLLAAALGIEKTRFIRASELGVTGAKTDRLLEICQRIGARHYLSGPSARSYLDEERMGEAGVRVEYMRYDYPEYAQLHPPFDPQVSVLDLLLMTGPEAPRYIWGSHGDGA